MDDHPLYSRYAAAIDAAIRAVGLKLHLCRPAAEDFGQDVRLHFLGAQGHRALASFEERSAERTYLFAVVLHYAYKRQRRERRARPQTSTGGRQGGDNPPPADIAVQLAAAPDLGPVDCLLEREALARGRAVLRDVARGIARLPPDLRLLLYDRYIAGECAGSLAGRMGVTRKAIYRRTDRAIERVRSSLETDGVTVSPASFYAAERALAS